MRPLRQYDGRKRSARRNKFLTTARGLCRVELDLAPTRFHFHSHRRMILHVKDWLIRHPLAFYVVAPFSFRKRLLQMAWIGLNARLLALGIGNFSESLAARNRRVFVRTVDGILVAYDFTRRDGGLHPMYIYDYVYEAAELEVIRTHLKPESTFIDIGANIGMHSIRANLGNIPDCSVLAIEADEATFRTLEANVRENSSGEQIQTRRAVLWSSIATIQWHGDQLEHGHNHASAARTETSHVLTSETLDTMLARMGNRKKISVIKIDVEGAEIEVLKGGERTLRTEKPALVIEIDDKLLARNGGSGLELRDYLRSLGYQSEAPIINANSRKAINSLFLP